MRLPESAQEEVFRRMVFNILANNTDDHNKNFSFLMNREGRWSLAPAYDLTYIFNIGGYLPETTHCLMTRGKLSGHTKEDALAIARENGIRKAESIIHQVADAVANFRNFAERCGVKEQWTSAVEATLNRNLEGWGLSIGKATLVSFTLNGCTAQTCASSRPTKETTTSSPTSTARSASSSSAGTIPSTL